MIFLYITIVTNRRELTRNEPVGILQKDIYLTAVRFGWGRRGVTAAWMETAETGYFGCLRRKRSALYSFDYWFIFESR